MLVARNFLTLKMASLLDVHVWILAGIWVVLLFTGIWSIFSRPLSVPVKVFWIAAILGLPIVGMVVYVFTCLASADWEFLKQMGFFNDSKKKLAETVQSPKA